MPSIFLFGDSITHGEFDTEGGGWTERLRREANIATAQGERWLGMYNLGIPGNRTDQLLERFRAETAWRVDPEEENMFVFAFGANDAAFIRNKNAFQIDPDVYVENVKKIIAQAREFGTKIVFLNSTPVIESVTAEPSRNKVRKNEYVEKYNARLADACNAEGVDVIDVYVAFMKEGHESLFDPDGVHPNSRGHEIIFEKVRSYLRTWGSL